MFSPYSALSLVRQRIHALRQSTERKNFMFLYVKRRITDPEEDEFWYVSVFSAPWFDSGYMLGVSLRGFLEEFRIIFPGFSVGDDFRIVSVFSAELGSTADTCNASVYGAEVFHIFHVKRWITDPEVTFSSLYLTVTCSFRRLRST